MQILVYQILGSMSTIKNGRWNTAKLFLSSRVLFDFIENKNEVKTARLYHFRNFLLKEKTRALQQNLYKTDTLRDRPKCPYYRGSEKHWHPTKRVKSSAYCARIGSNKHKMVYQSKIKILKSVAYYKTIILYIYIISQHNLHTMSDKI